MLEALVSGTRDPEVLSELARGKLRKKIPQLERALEGRFVAAHHGFMVGQILAKLDFWPENDRWITATLGRAGPGCGAEPRSGRSPEADLVIGWVAQAASPEGASVTL